MTVFTAIPWVTSYLRLKFHEDEIKVITKKKKGIIIQES